MPDEMEAAAQASGCTRTVTFSQVALLQGALQQGAPGLTALGVDAGGICYGLAFVWMEYKARANYDRFFDDVNAWADRPTTEKAARLYKVVQNQSDATRQAAAQCGLRATGEGGAFESKVSLDVRDPADMKALAGWLAAAVGERYFLVTCHTHVMAASGSRLGRLQFFDPNFGVVQSFSCDSMARFFGLLFASGRVRAGYFRKGEPPRLGVTKFQKS